MPQMSPVLRLTLVRFAAAITIGNLAWEIAHMPLYTLWLTGTWSGIAYAVIHCAAGDVIIASLCLGGALVLFGRAGWPEQNYATVAAATIIASLCYTVFSEWLNIELRAAWAYRDIMPLVPPFGTGLTPFLQWIIVPSAAFLWAAPRRTKVR
jgi:hypothetical protein